MIQFCNVTKEYRGNPVLKNLNMEIQEGELTVIIGLVDVEKLLP